MPSLIDLMLEGRQVQQHSPWPRATVDCFGLDICGKRAGTGTLEPTRPLGRTSTVHMAIMDGHTAEIATVSLDCPDRNYPSVGKHHPPAFAGARHQRSVRLSAERLARYSPVA